MAVFRCLSVLCAHSRLFVLCLWRLYLTSVRCVMGCSAAMATGVLRVLPVGVLCSDCPLGFLVLNAAFTVRIVGKGTWKSDRERVSGRLCGPQAERDSIIWSAWVGEGCVPVSFQRETLVKCVWDRAESSDAHTHFSVLPCNAYQTEKSGVESCPGEYMHVLCELYTWVIRCLWRFVALHKFWLNYKRALFWVFFFLTVLGLFI